MNNIGKYLLVALVVTAGGFAYIRNPQAHIPADLRDAVASEDFNTDVRSMAPLKGAVPVPAPVGVNAEHRAAATEKINKSFVGQAVNKQTKSAEANMLPAALETAYQDLAGGNADINVSRFEKVKALFENAKPVTMKDMYGNFYVGRSFNRDNAGRFAASGGSALALVGVVQEGTSTTTPGAGPLFPAETVTTPGTLTPFPVWRYTAGEGLYDRMPVDEFKKMLLALGATWSDGPGEPVCWARDTATGITGFEPGMYHIFDFEIRKSGDYLIRWGKDTYTGTTPEISINYGYFWIKK